MLFVLLIDMALRYINSQLLHINYVNRPCPDKLTDPLSDGNRFHQYSTQVNGSLAYSNFILSLYFQLILTFKLYLCLGLFDLYNIYVMNY